MWDIVRNADIEHARHQLARRREEMLARHAAEITALDNDEEEIGVLDRLAASFARKFRNVTASAPASAAAPEPELPEPEAQLEPKPEPQPRTRPAEPPAAAKPQPAAPLPVGRRPGRNRDDRPNYAGTNFDVFSRAAMSQL